MSRRRVVEAEELYRPNFARGGGRSFVDVEPLVRQAREVFADREIEYEHPQRWVWPPKLRHAGDSLAIAYGSDKWQPPDERGRREVEFYKHLAESRNFAFVPDGVLLDYRTGRVLPTYGHYLNTRALPLPKQFAEIGSFEESHLHLHAGMDGDTPYFGDGVDDRVVKLTYPGAKVGFSYMKWPSRKPEPFFFVYTPSKVLLIVTGMELSIGKDGLEG